MNVIWNNILCYWSDTSIFMKMFEITWWKSGPQTCCLQYKIIPFVSMWDLRMHSWYYYYHHSIELIPICLVQIFLDQLFDPALIYLIFSCPSFFCPVDHILLNWYSSHRFHPTGSQQSQLNHHCFHAWEHLALPTQLFSPASFAEISRKYF